MRDYVAYGMHVVGLGIQFAGQPTVTRVVFLTIRDLGGVSSDPEWASFGLSMKDNYPLDMFVCYAGLSGTFIVSDGPGHSNSTSAAFVVLDAHTGNQIVTGVGAPLR